MKHKVVIAEHVDGNIEIESEVLGPDVEIVLCKAQPAEAFMEAIKDCDALMTTNAKPMNRSELAGMPNCRVVARYGIGYDSIDVEAATDLGIMVTNNPSYCIDEVAEHALALMLSAWRRVTQHAIAVKAGEWAPLGGGKIRRLKGRILGILGFGAIGQALATRASGLGMDIVFHDPFVNESPLARSVSMDELLQVSDVLSLHMPLIDSTRGIVDQAFLGKMKQDAILVNCSRGPLIKTDDLLEALNAGEIGMAALDTVDPEPIPKSHPLLDCPNALITPHCAWFSEESIIDLRRIAAANVAAALRGELPTNLVNKDVKLSGVSK